MNLPTRQKDRRVGTYLSRVYMGFGSGSLAVSVFGDGVASDYQKVGIIDVCQGGANKFRIVIRHGYW